MRRRAVAVLVLSLLSVSCGEDPAPPAQRLALDSACDVGAGCVVRIGGHRLTVRMAPRRAALQPFELSLSTDLPLDTVVLDLKMKGMDMGRNRYRLQRTGDGVWRARPVLPVCTSGRSDWLAEFELEAGALRYRLDVPFTVGD